MIIDWTQIKARQENHLCAEADKQLKAKNIHKHNNTKADDILFFLQTYSKKRQRKILSLAISKTNK